MRTIRIAGLSILMLLSGCAAQIDQPDIDYKKASAANTELGAEYLKRGKYKVAMSKFKKAIKFDDENANAHHYIAELYRRLEQNEDAEKHFKIALDLKEEDSQIKNNYAIFLCGTSRYEQGIELLNKVLLDPLYSAKGQAYENMGLCALNMGNLKLAERYFNQALVFNKQLPSALLGMAQIKFDSNKIRDASRFYNRYTKIAPQTAQSLWLGVLIERKAGNKGRSGSYAVLLRGKFPDSKEAALLEKMNIR